MQIPQIVDARDWISVREAAIRYGFDVGSDERQAHNVWVNSKPEPSLRLTADLELLRVLTRYAPATISNAIRGTRHPLSPKDAKRVRELALTLGFSPRTRKPKVWQGKEIAVGMEFFGKPSFSYHEDILRSLNAKLRDTDGRVSLFDLSDKRIRERFFNDPPNLSVHEGLILVNTQAGADELASLARAYPALPVVLMHDNRPNEGSKYPELIVANIFPDLCTEESGYRKLIRHVLVKHHRKQPLLAIVPESDVETRIIKKRVFEEECLRLNLKPRVYAELVDYTVTTGFRLGTQLSNLFGEIDVLFCGSDTVAVGVHKVRPDLLVTGFDNNDLAEAFGISSVDQGLAKCGEEAVSALQHGIEEWRRRERIAVTRTIRVDARIRCCSGF